MLQSWVVLKIVVANRLCNITLSGEGNENVKKNNFARAAHFFVHFFALFYTTTTWNFQKFLSYTFYGGNVVRVLFHFFVSSHFHLKLVATSISYFLTAATKFSCCSSRKKLSPLFISRSRFAFFLVDFRWSAAYFLFFSVLLLLYIPNLWTWQLI